MTLQSSFKSTKISSFSRLVLIIGYFFFARSTLKNCLTLGSCLSQRYSLLGIQFKSFFVQRGLYADENAFIPSYRNLGCHSLLVILIRKPDFFRLSIKRFIRIIMMQVSVVCLHISGLAGAERAKLIKGLHSAELSFLIN